MCEETVYWDLNYSLLYQEAGTQHIKAKVTELCKNLNNNLYTHPNFVFLAKDSIRELVGMRVASSSEPLVIFNNLLRWAIFQLDSSLLEVVDDKRAGDIPVTERTKLITKIREEKVKDFTFSDIWKYLDIVLALMPWREMSQSNFVNFVAHTNILPQVKTTNTILTFLDIFGFQEMLLAASLAIMEEALKNPERLNKSSYLFANDPNTVKTELTKAMEKTKTRCVIALLLFFITINFVSPGQF